MRIAGTNAMNGSLISDHGVWGAMPLRVRNDLLGLAQSCFTSADKYDVVYGIEALGAIGDPRSVSRLQHFLGGMHEVDASVSLGRLGDVSNALTIVKRHLTYSPRPQERNRRQERDWQRQMQRGKILHAIKALGVMGSADGLNLLEGPLTDADGTIRLMAMEAVGMIGDARGLDLIERYLERFFNPRDTDAGIMDAALAIGRIGDPRGLKLLKLLLTHRDNHYVEGAIAAIGMIGDSSGLELIEPFVAYGDRHFQMTVAEAIGRIGAPQGLPLLKGVLDKDPEGISLHVAKAVGAIGDPRGKELIEPILGYRHDENEQAIIAAAESLGRLGEKERACRILKKFTANAEPPIFRPAVEALATLGFIEDVFAALEEQLASGVADRVAAAAEALGQIGHPRGIDLLEPLLSNTTKDVVRAAAKALGRIGDERSLKVIKAAALDAEFCVDFIKAFVQAYRSSTTAESIVGEAALIRRVCARGHGDEYFSGGRGLFQRGRWPGIRSDSVGFEFEEHRELKTGDLITGRIDAHASARTDKVIERRYREQQSRNVMLVIDPTIFRDNNPERNERVRLAMGTIAQMVLQWGDAVGMVIGMGGVYRKPSRSKSQLLHILEDIRSYVHANGRVSVVRMMEQKAVRRNLTVGSEVIVISSFGRGDIEIVDAVAKKMRAKGINVQAIKIDRSIVLPRPVVDAGGWRFPVHEDVIREIGGRIAVEQARKIEEVLRRNGGFVLDIEGGEDVKGIPQRVLAQLRPAVRNEAFFVSDHVTLDGIEVFELQRGSDDSSSKKRQLRDIDMAKLKGDVDFFWRIKNQLENIQRSCSMHSGDQEELDRLHHAFQETEEPPSDAIEDIDESEGGVGRLPLERWAGKKLPLGLSLAWGPGRKFYREFVLLARAYGADRAFQFNGDLRAPKDPSRDARMRKVDGGLFGSDLALDPSASGVEAASYEDVNGIWQTIDPPPRGRHAYLWNIAAVDFESATCRYSGRDELACHRFDEMGEQRGSGKVLVDIPDDVRSLPRPVGGTVLGVEHNKYIPGAVVFYAYGDAPEEQASRLMNMSLSALRIAGASIYGAELYAALTRTVDAGTVAPYVHRDWVDIIERLGELSVLEAMRVVQATVISHPRLHYHHYGNTARKLEAFSTFKVRAARGLARGLDEHLMLALELGGGACFEMTKIMTALLRQAGIPSIIAGGWLARNGKVKRVRHVWPMAVFPRSDGGWYGEPVEASVPFIQKKQWELALQKLRDFQFSRSSPYDWRARTPMDVMGEVSGVLEKVPQVWERADVAARSRIARWLSELPSIIDLAHHTWHGTNQAVSDLIIKHWGQHAVSKARQERPHDPAIYIPAGTMDNRQKQLLVRWARILEMLFKEIDRSSP